jgi:hypothetical protein
MGIASLNPSYALNTTDREVLVKLRFFEKVKMARSEMFPQCVGKTGIV